MLLFNENAISSGLGYTIENSLRFRSSASAYLNRTFGTGDRKTWTWSGWVKRGTLGSDEFIFASVGPGGFGIGADIVFVGDTLRFIFDYNAGSRWQLVTTPVYRDPSSWYHFVVCADTTNATSTDRLRIYVNGVRVTNFSTVNYPTLNADGTMNQAYAHNIGQQFGSNYFDGYMAEVNFIDGQALTPASFGEINASTNSWTAKEYTGTYGTNGFYLPFTDTTSTTTLVADSSGNGNDWTPNNISLTAGVTYDSMIDSPTNNFCVLNSVARSISTNAPTPANGNLDWVAPSSTTTTGWPFVLGTIGTSSGKWYYEIDITVIQTNSVIWGGWFTPDVINDSDNTDQFSKMMGFIIRNDSASTGLRSFVGSTGTTQDGADATTGVYQIAFDFDAGKFWIGKNNTWYASGNPSAGSSEIGTFAAGLTMLPFIGNQKGTTDGNSSTSINFGQRPFTYTPPTGFKSLNTANLPEPTIGTSPTNSPDDYFKTYLYRGNGGGLQVGEIQKPFTAYNVERSLRFRSSASAYLSRTFGTPTSTTTWSLSAWIKRGILNTNAQLFSAGGDFIYFSGTTMTIKAVSGAILETTQVFNDPSAWYHIVVLADTTSATANNRVRLYVNGTEVTVFSSRTNPSQNAATIFNALSSNNRIGGTGSIEFFDGYMAEVNFIDGQALTPASFGEFDGNNYWVPKTYSGSYGTNGFYLDFKDNGNIGNDAAGSNDWTPNNFEVATPGITYDWMIDSPTLYDDGGNGRGNYCTLNPLDRGTTYLPTLSNGNLNFVAAYNTQNPVRATLGTTSGKWYFEATCVARNYNPGVGVIGINSSLGTGDDFRSLWGTQAAAWYSFYGGGNSIVSNGSFSSYETSFVASDVIMVAYDVDTGKFWVGKNGTWNASGDPANGANNAATFAHTDPIVPFLDGTYVSSPGDTWAVNFGQRPFSYTPPTDFKALNSYNIDEITDDLEQPDFVWIKARNLSQNHALFDRERGVQNLLKSNSTDAAATDVNSLLQFNKNGFLLGSSAAVNTVNEPYVAWVWKEGTTPGFDIVTYTGNGSTQNINHNLGAVPRMMIVKSRSTAQRWTVFHTNTSNAYLYLNETFAAETTNANLRFGNNSTVVQPTSSVFTIGNTVDVNQNTTTYVAYLFAEVPGFSKFGSYTGNGSADGTFVFCGFRPRFVMIKRTNTTGNWIIHDNMRLGYNGSSASKELYPNLSLAEGTDSMDQLSNGFKLRDTYSDVNASGSTYIFAAFAETPFKYSLAR